MDRILGNAQCDTIPESLKNAKAKFEATVKVFTKPANPRPFLRLAPLTGNFVNPSFGKVVLTLKDDALVAEVRATGAKLKLVPLDGDIFIATLMATDQFGPVVDLDYMTKGLPSFKWIKMENSICCGFPPWTVRSMNSGANSSPDRSIPKILTLGNNNHCAQRSGLLFLSGLQTTPDGPIIR